MTSSFENNDNKLFIKKPIQGLTKASTSRSITRERSVNKIPTSLNQMKTAMNDNKRLLSNHSSLGFGIKSQQ
jgi:hypothetical protein